MLLKKITPPLIAFLAGILISFTMFKPSVARSQDFGIRIDEDGVKIWADEEIKRGFRSKVTGVCRRHKHWDPERGTYVHEHCFKRRDHDHGEYDD